MAKSKSKYARPYYRLPAEKRAAIRAFHDLGWETKKICRHLSVSDHTVRNVLSGEPDAIELRMSASLKEHLPATMRVTAARLVDKLGSRTVINDMKGRDLAVAAGIMIDKARLEAGETTGNVGLVLQIQAQADNDYMASLKASAIPAEIVHPAPALPEPPAVVEAPKAEKVQACPAKRRKTGAR